MNYIKEKMMILADKLMENKLILKVAIVIMAAYEVGFGYYMISRFNLDELSKGNYELIASLIFGLFLWVLAIIYKKTRNEK